MKSALMVIGALVAFSLLLITCNTCNKATQMVNNGINTAYEQYKPEVLLKKYEWFKDAAAQCDQKLATLETYNNRFKSIKKSYGADSLKRSAWSRDDREQWNIWQSEYLGVKASYNQLAGEYNAAMSKFNYAFCNRGDMPITNAEPLPREFKPYIRE